MQSTIPQKSPVKQVTLSAAILVAIFVGGLLLLHSGRKEPVEQAPAADPNTVKVAPEGRKIADIKVAVAHLTQLQDTLNTSGLVSYPPDQTVKVTPKLTGRIDKVLVKVGDRVTAGQVLATLSSVDAATAQSTALQAGMALKQAQLDLERNQRLYKLGTPDVSSAEAALSQAEQGEESSRAVLKHVEYQAKIGGFADKPIEDAENAVVAAVSTLSQANSDLSLAQRDFDRKKKLVEIGVNSQSDLESSQNVLEKATASVQAAEKALTLARQASSRERNAYKTGLYSDQQIEQAAGAHRQAILQVDAARTALRLAKTQIKRDLDASQTAYETAHYSARNSQTALTLLGNPDAEGRVPIKSPISGIVTERDVNPGQVVDQSQMAPWQLMVISNPDHVWVEADVFEKDIAAVKVGSTVDVHVAALPGRTFTGSVLQIAPTLDKTSRSIKVRAEIPNPGRLLRDGEFADVTLKLGPSRSSLVVPMSAISHEGKDDYVYLGEGDQFTKSKVTRGIQQGQDCEIKSGLKPGQKIAISGALFLGGQVSDD